MANFVCILSPSPTIFKGYAVKNTAQVFQASCGADTNLVPMLQPRQRQAAAPPAGKSIVKTARYTRCRSFKSCGTHNSAPWL